MTLHKTYWLGISLISLFAAGASIAAPKEEIIPLGTDEQSPATRRADRSAAPRVELFGQIRLRNRAGLAASSVNSCGRRGERVAGLRFRVLNSPAVLAQAEVHFGNGARQVLPLMREFAPNSDSGWIAFSRIGGRNPCVKAVTLSGHNGNLTPDSAVVQIFGLVNEALPAERRDARRGNLKVNPRARLTLSQAHP